MAVFTSLSDWLAGKESKELSSALGWTLALLEDSWPSGPRKGHQHRLEKAGRLPLTSRGKKAFASQLGHQFATWPCASHSSILGFDSPPINWRWWCFMLFQACVFFTCGCLINVSFLGSRCPPHGDKKHMSWVTWHRGGAWHTAFDWQNDCCEYQMS